VLKEHREFEILEIRERSTHSHSIYEQRLMCHYEKVLKMLREVQAERKVQEAREQEAIYEIGMCHLVAGRVWLRLFESGSRVARQAQMDARTRKQRPHLELRS